MKKLKKVLCVIITITMLISICTVNPSYAEAETQSDDGYHYITAAYVNNWNGAEVDASILDIAYYAFAMINPNTYELYWSGTASRCEADVAALAAQKAQYPNFKVILSIGGENSASSFAAMAQDKENRDKFVASCVDFCGRYGFDGIDIDWEMPNSSTKASYTALCKELYEALNPTGRIVTAATTSSSWGADGFDWAELNKYLSYFNIMSYSYAWDQSPVHDSSLYDSMYTISGVSADRGVQRHINGGVDPRKIILGVPFYGVRMDVTGTGVNPYSQTVLNLLANGNYIEYWDELAQSSYAVNKETGNFVITFTTPSTIASRAAYIKEKCIGGIFCWDYGQDNTSAGTLKNAMYNYMNDIAEPLALAVDVSAQSGGSVSGDASGTYYLGDVLTVTAVSDSGYKFTGWYEGAQRVSTEKSYTFSLKGLRKLVARFEESELEVISFTVSSNDVRKSITFTADTDGGFGPVSYAYYIYKGGKLYYSADNYNESFNYTFVMPGNYTIKVIAKDESGAIATKTIFNLFS